jgi:hypothetical protein
MTIPNEEFENFIKTNLPIYRKTEDKSAKKILRALPKWRKAKINWLIWWKGQNLELRINLQNFLFWMVREGKLSIEIYENIHNALTPIQSSSKSIPVSLVESSGTPKFEGGIVEQEWTICNYSFKSTNETGKWDVCYQTYPNENTPSAELDLVLSALSFEVKHNQRKAKIGFMPFYYQETTQSQTEAAFVGLHPTIHTLPEIDFGQVEKLITISQVENKKGLSIAELLRVRHRAITDSSDESKLITLWGVIEIEFGDNKKRENLFEEEEIRKLRKVLEEITTDLGKQDKIIQEISKLKKKTKNTIIKEAINVLKCSNGHDIDTEIESIVGLRGRLAHGAAIDKSQRLKLLQGVTFLFEIINEIIENKIMVQEGI